MRINKIFYLLFSFICLTSTILYGQESGNNIDKEGVALRDLAQIQGLRSNQLLGYGLVVGLPGTGDSRSKFASTAIKNLLSGIGQKIEDTRLSRSRNIAAVLVTGELNSFSKIGSRLNATVSSVGDASSLSGGILIQTPLYAGNREIYAVAQGSITTGGKDSNSSKAFKGGKTVGLLLSGVIIEKELDTGIFKNTADNKKVRVALKNFNFTTLYEVKQTLENSFPNTKTVLDGGAILVDIPQDTNSLEFIAKMEKLRIKTHAPSRVVINERTGTIITGGDVQVDPVGISRSGLGIGIKKDQTNVNLGFGADTEKKDKQTITHKFEGGHVIELIQSLNSIGANVKDLIAILEALSEAGALHGQLIVN